MPSDLEPDGQWDRVASELRAYRAAQREAWGDIDNATLGRYLAGEVDGEERRQVENALEELPELRKLTDLVRDVMGADLEQVSAPAAGVPAPATLPFRKPAPVRKSPVHWSVRRGALVAAACILLVLGVVLPQAQFYSPLGSGGRSPVTQTVAYHSPTPGELAAPAGPKLMMAKREDQEPPPTIRMLEPVALAWADGMDRAGSYSEANGDYDRAEYFLKMAHSIRNSMLGPDAPPTVESRQKLADVYQVALNTDSERLSVSPPSPPSDPRPLNPPAGVVADDAKKGNAWNSACQLRERITRQPVGEVRKNVAPVLAQNLRDAETPAARMQYGRALAELGAGAREAVPALKQWLERADNAEEQRAAVDSLAEIAPAAPDAMPVLVASLDSKSAESRRAAKDALTRLGADAKAGYKVVAGGAGGAADKHDPAYAATYRLGLTTVRDECEVFSPRALKRVQKESKELARDFHVVVFTDMVSDLNRAETKDADGKDRAERGANGVYVYICKQPLTVRVVVGDALRRQGFDGDQEAQLQKVLETHLAREEYDEGLLEGVRFVARFEAAQRNNNATPPAPNP